MSTSWYKVNATFQKCGGGPQTHISEEIEAKDGATVFKHLEALAKQARSYIVSSRVQNIVREAGKALIPAHWTDPLAALTTVALVKTPRVGVSACMYKEDGK